MRQVGALPQILMRRLRRGDVEAVVEAVLEALQDMAFVLERVARHQVQLPRPDAHDHAGVSERATSSIRYASIRSPTFRSLKFSTPIPHSNPSRTSRTSSLKRFSEDSVPAYTSTPARASSTSESVIAPTPRCTTSTFTSGVESWASASARASAGPP